MSSLRVMVQRNRGEEKKKKKTGKDGETAAPYCDRKQFLLEVLLQKLFEITTESSPASLIVETRGIPLAEPDPRPIYPQRSLLSLSSLSDFFRS